MPLLDLFWTILMVIVFAAWIWVLISVLADVFRSDISGASKALWILFTIVIPRLGVLVYVIVRGGDMQPRSTAAAAGVDQAQRDYIHSAAGAPVSAADELSKLAGLRDAGVITDDEYRGQKDKLLA